MWRNPLALHELEENGQRYARMGATVHAGEIGARRRIGQFILIRLLDDAIEELQRLNGAIDAHRIADLDGSSQRFLGDDRLIGLEPCLVAAVERIGALGLGADETW